MAQDEYIEMLRSKLDELQKTITEKKFEVQNIFTQIDNLQKQGEHIIALLKAENADLDENLIQDVQQTSIADEAYKYISSFKDQTPIHYRDLAEKIMSLGIPIPGKDAAANLLSHIGRDERFVRTASGTYGLAEWGLKPATTKRTKKRRQRRN